MAESHPGGRPTSLTDDVALAIVEALEAGCSIADACAIAGIGRSTFHEWMQRGEAGEPKFADFADLVKQARAKRNHNLVERIDTAGNRDWRALAFLLERSDPESWGSKTRTEHTHSGPKGGPIPVSVAPDPSTAESALGILAQLGIVSALGAPEPTAGDPVLPAQPDATPDGISPPG